MRDDGNRNARLASLRRAVTRLLLAIGAVLFVSAAVGYVTGVRLNLSGSIPPGLYRTKDGPLKHGTIVLACLPGIFSQFAKQRGYVPSGSCEDGRAPIGKVVVATAGDIIDVSTRGVSVNGVLLRNTAPLQKDSEGRRLPILRVSGRVVPAGEVWLASSYSTKSFDSRYFGGISSSAVVSRVQPLLTTSGW